MRHKKYLTQGEKLKKTMIAKYGSERAYRRAMKERAAKSSRNPQGRGGILDITDEERRQLSRKGGVARSEKYRAKREKEAPIEETTSSEEIASSENSVEDEEDTSD